MKFFLGVTGQGPNLVIDEINRPILIAFEDHIRQILYQEPIFGIAI